MCVSLCFTPTPHHLNHPPLGNDSCIFQQCVCPFRVELIVAACRRQFNPLSLLSPSLRLSPSLFHPSDTLFFITIPHLRTWRERLRIETQIFPSWKNKPPSIFSFKVSACLWHSQTHNYLLLKEKVCRDKVLERCGADRFLFNMHKSNE